MMKRTALALLAALAASPACAQDRPTGWQTWTWDGSCYAIVYAQSSTLPGTSADRSYIAVKHIPKEKTYDGVAIVSGLDVPAGTEGIIDVGGQEYPLLVFQSAGYVRSGDPEKTLVEALGKSADAKVTWFLKDQMAVQSYKLEGFQAAKSVIDVACPRAGAPRTEAKGEDEEAAKPAKPARHARRGRG